MGNFHKRVGTSAWEIQSLLNFFLWKFFLTVLIKLEENML